MCRLRSQNTVGSVLILNFKILDTAKIEKVLTNQIRVQ